MGNQDQFNVFGLQVIISVLIFVLRKNFYYLCQNVTNHQNYCSSPLHILPWLNSNFPHVIKKFPTITAGSNFCVCSNIFPHTTTVHMIQKVCITWRIWNVLGSTIVKNLYTHVIRARSGWFIVYCCTGKK